MKTKPLSRSSDGSYAGSIGSEYQLTAKEQRKVREALSKGPKYVSQIAKECGVSVTDPKRFGVLCEYVDHLGKNTQEAEMIFEQAKTGRKFIGWQLTAHGEKLLEIS